MVGTRGPQNILEGYARDVARGGGGRTMRDNIAAMDLLVAAGLVSDGNSVDGSTITGGRAYDTVIAQYPHDPLHAWEIPAPLLDLSGLSSIYLPLVGGTITTGGLFLDYRDSQPTTDNSSSGILVRWTNTETPGPLPPLNTVSAPINVVASDYDGAITSIWGVAVSMSVYSTQFGGVGIGPWPQHVGGSFTVFKYGNCYVAGAHLTSVETTNRVSSLNGPLHGLEIAHQSNADDDGGLASAPGLRFGVHLSQAQRVASGSGGVDCVFGIGYGQSNSGGSTTKSAFAAVDSVTYQVFDARRATAPSGYTDPVAGLRMKALQIVDFNGSATTTKAGWIGPAGSYLQYYAGNKLRWVDGGTELFSIRDDGLVQIAGSMIITTPPGVASLRILVEQFISFTSADNRILMYTNTGGNRLSYVAGGVERFNIPDAKPAVTGSRGGNAALASLITKLATYGLVTDSTTA